MPFGRHKGQAVDQVPSDYLAWLARTCKLSSGQRAEVGRLLHDRGVAGPALEPPPPKPVSCPRCGCLAMRHAWAQDRLGRKQIRKECTQCGTWAGYAPQVEPYLTEANAN